VLKEKIRFEWSDWTLKKCGSKQALLTERTDIANRCYEYLQQMKKHREECRHIYYLDKTRVSQHLKMLAASNIHGILMSA
jgi:hypothetical protein